LDRDGAVSLGYEAAPDVALPVDERTEWLEADGLGGFSSGTTSGVRTHRYHALLLAAARPPADRRVLVSGFLATLHTPAGSATLYRKLKSYGRIGRKHGRASTDPSAT
jgi:hypothetical protein